MELCLDEAFKRGFQWRSDAVEDFVMPSGFLKFESGLELRGHDGECLAVWFGQHGE
jgi:hypothetical protein